MKDNLKKQILNQNQALYPQIQTISLQKQQINTSQFYEYYIQLTGFAQSPQIVKQCEELLKKNNIAVNSESNFKQCVQFQILQTDLESISLKLYYGKYQLKVSVLMTQLNENYFTTVVVSKGTYGSIYFVKNQQKNYAIKRVFLKQNKYDSQPEQLYKQYFLCYIASVLKVGPKIQTLFGYDIIFTKDSAFFVMQFCQDNLANNHEEAYNQMIQNMRIIHSLRIVHQDIKPANLAYSHSFKKYIFIDFGLSRFIKNNIGQKTFTKYVGTLSFCSQQMKKNYFSNKGKQIDLYYNDSIALKNSFNVIRTPDNNEEGYQKSICHILYRNQRQVNVMSSSIYVLLLKYYLSTNNFEKVFQTLPKIKNLNKSTYAVLSSKQANNFISRNQKAKREVIRIRSQILEEIKIDSIPDNVISQALLKSNQNEGTISFVLLSHVLSLPDEQFKKVIKNQEYLIAVLLNLEEFLKEQNIINQQKQTFYIKIINKINDKNKPTPAKRAQTPQMYEKIGYFLRFINQNLIKGRNSKVLNILRILFVAMQQWKVIQSLEDEIVNSITNPFLKCIKITQFLLFWQVINYGLNSYKINSWIEIIQRLQDNNNIHKLKQISLEIIKQKKCRYFSSYEQQIIINSSKICQLMQNSQIKQFHQQIQTIYILYLQLNNVSKSIKTSNPILMIYSASFYFTNLQYPGKIVKQSSFWKLFISYTYFIEKQIIFKWRLLEKNQKILQNCIKYVFSIFQGRPDLLSFKFLRSIQRFLCWKKVIMFFVVKIKQNLQILYNNNSDLSPLQIYTFQKICFNMFLYIQNNSYVSLNQRIDKESLIIISQNMRSIIFIHKNLINYIKQEAFKKQLLVIQRILQLKYKFLIDGCEGTQNDVKQIYEIIKLEYKGRYLFVFCQILLQIVEIKYNQSIIYAQEIIIQICEQSMALQYFQYYPRLLFQYIKINGKRKQNKKSRDQLQRFLTFIQQKNTKLRRKVTLQQFAVRYSIQSFYLLSNLLFLKSIYNQISFKKCEFEGRCYPFYVFSIFSSLYPKYYSQRQIIQKQIKRTCLCLKRMYNIQSLYTKDAILFSTFALKSLKSNRKKLIYARMQIRSIHINDRQIPNMTKELFRKRIQGIKNVPSTKKIYMYIIKQYLLKKWVVYINF